MRQYIKIVKESVYNTPAASPAASDIIWLELAESDASIDATPQVYTIRGARPSRGVVDINTGASQYAVAGSITTQLYHEQANFWKTAVFEPTVTSGIPDLPSYTVFRSYASNGGTWRTERFTGCKFTGVTLSGSNAAAQAPVTMTLNLVGSQWTDTGVSLTAPGCTDFPTSVYLWSGTDLLLNNTSLKSVMRSASIQIQHNTNPIFHANQYADRIAYYGWNPSLSVQMDLDSHVYTSKMMSILTSFSSAQYATNNKLEFTYAATKKVTFNLYNVVWNQLSTSRPPGGDFMQNGSLKPYYDCTNLDVTCTITNPAA
jgi:hypothetical protein